MAALQASGPAGVADGRSQRAADPLGGVGERWLEMCRLVLAEHIEASRPTQELVLRRISARLSAGHGEGTVPEPGRRRARAVLAELTRGSNAFTGSTKGKRSIAARPQGVYGRLRPTRPGEFLLLDTTPLDVFAMEVLSVSWATTLQQEIPPEKLSRVSSYDALGNYALTPVGTAIAGPLASAFGTPAVLAAGGALVVILPVLVLLVLLVPEVRHMRRK